jgi:hypothetical protein
MVESVGSEDLVCAFSVDSASELSDFEGVTEGVVWGVAGTVFSGLCAGNSIGVVGVVDFSVIGIYFIVVKKTV